METTPALTGCVGGTTLSPPTDDPPFVDRIADKARMLAAVKPALVRLLEWQIDQELERSEQREGHQ